VSIDRSIGEGSKITVRGVGPDFNMVLLNGRQMPTSNLGDLNGRAFDFANLASEAISQIQVYKTSRAESPTGGIGATLNVMTARPFERPGLHASIGAKAVHDTTNGNLPGDVKASNSTTPEVSGIYSNTFADNTFGVALTGSYQERNLGYNTAAVSNGWRGPFRGDENNWGTIPQGPSDACPACTITNRPTGSHLYSVPQNLNYNFNGVKRQRTNAQLTLQYKPVSSWSPRWTTPIRKTRSRPSATTCRPGSTSARRAAWTSGSPSSPLNYKEFVANSDIAMGAADFATKTQNKSLGFNAVWKPSSDLRFELDTHHSTATSGADSPFGSSNTLAPPASAAATPRSTSATTSRC
jgi:TonB-dependent receptor